MDVSADELPQYDDAVPLELVATFEVENGALLLLLLLGVDVVGVPLPVLVPPTVFSPRFDLSLSILFCK